MKTREVIRKLEDEGWFLYSTKGSHRHFKHPNKPGKITVAGKPNHEIPPGTLSSILKQAQLKGFRP